MIRVNATGCSLIDNLYGNVSFDTQTYRRYLSRNIGDGGLVSGALTFSEALSDFANADYSEVLDYLTDGRSPDNSNIGGPGIVPILHAAQVVRSRDIRYRFAGVLGRDANAKRFRELLERTGFPISDYRVTDAATPSTDVLSDPDYGGGRGERTFINTIGAAGSYGPESLPRYFFDAEILLFGATALVPPLHDELDALCRRGREAGALVMVCTVFDFRNEARMKGKPWPLVADYSNIDLLAMDREESLKISGEANPKAAINWFLNAGCGAVLVTQGAEDVFLGTASTGPFSHTNRETMPTCRYADQILATVTTPRDTTGCGDNFVGGVIDSIAHQMADHESREDCGKKLNLEEAVVSGIAAGSLALTCLGGVYYEEEPGEKWGAMKPYFKAYRRQLADIGITE